MLSLINPYFVFLIENICLSLKTLILKGQGPSAEIKTQKLLFTIGAKTPWSWGRMNDLVHSFERAQDRIPPPTQDSPSHLIETRSQNLETK